MENMSPMEKLKPLLPLLVLFVFAIAVILYLFPVTHPYGGLNLAFKSSDIVEQSHTILKEMHVDISDLLPDVELTVNQPLFKQVQELFGLAKANDLLHDSIPAYRWSVRWIKESELRLGFDHEDERTKKREEKISDSLRGTLSMIFDTRGKVLEFNRVFSDSLSLQSLSPAEAKIAAIHFLQHYTAETILADTGQVHLEKTIQQPHRTDYEFEWKRVMPALGNTVRMKIRVAGNVVAHYEQHEEIPESFQKEKKQDVLGVVYALLLAFAVIGMIIITIRRIRAYEIGFRLALMIGILIAVVSDIDLFLDVQRQQSGWGLLIILLITPVFIGGALTLMWALAESITREVWREKLTSLDLLSKGYFVHSKIGESIIRGIMLGALGFALSLFLIWLGESVTPLSVTPSAMQRFHIFTTSMPALYIFTHSLYSTSFLYTFVVLFGVSFFRKYIRYSVILVLVGSAVLALFNLDKISPPGISFVIHTVIGIIVVWTFVRYDALASFLVLFSQYALEEISGLIVSGNSSYSVSGYSACAVFLLLVVGYFLALFRRNETDDFESIAPSFVKHITERQRMQQELEIARKVQMSFLPKKNPSLPQFEIASRCAPALEVGGDYYDFIEISEQKLAIAIGDVSGKGTQAAFFMTLTKGFLRALAHVSESPAKVLTQVNHLFYENVERGIFISMIYGVFDTMKKTLILARAGHNPIMMRKSHSEYVQIVNPAGLALGLDAGSIFSQSIEEVKIQYQHGDLFVFYTDGFTEALNSNQEQFGEERLSRAVEQRASGTAAEIMDGVFAEIKSFVGKSKQHDDMTIVVIKVTSVP
jgi:phosphoserine phosphatase RsbU/P